MSKKKIDVNRLIKIVGAMETRIALASGDIQLEKVCTQSLPKLLGLFQIDNHQLRNKLIEVVKLAHLRVKTEEGTVLSSKLFLDLYLKFLKNPFISNFSFLFFKLAFARDKNNHANLSSLFENLTKIRNEQMREKFLFLILKIIYESEVIRSNLNDNNEKLRVRKKAFFQEFRNEKNLEIRKIVVKFFLKLMFMDNWEKHLIEGNHEGIIDVSKSFQIKISIVKFLIMGEFKMEEILPHIVVGVAANNLEMSRICGNFMKKQRMSLDLEDKKIVEILFDMYLGRLEEQRRELTNGEKVILLEKLCKSQSSTKSILTACDVLRRSLFDNECHLNARSLGIQYFLLCLNYGFRDLIPDRSDDRKMRDEEDGEEDEEELDNEGNVKALKEVFQLLGDLTYMFLQGTENDEKMSFLQERNYSKKQRFKESIYSLFANFLKVFPKFISDLRNRGYMYFHLFFYNLKLEAPSVKLVIQQSLNTIMYAYNIYFLNYPNSTTSIRSKIIKLFYDIVFENKFFDEEDSKQTGRVSVLESLISCTNQVFSFDDCQARLLNAVLISHQSLRIRDEASRGLKAEIFKIFNERIIFKELRRTVKFPNFVELVHAFKDLLKKYGERSISYESYVSIMEFSKQCLIENKNSFSETISLKEYVNSEVIKKDHAVFDEFLSCIFSSLEGNSSASSLLETSKTCLWLLSIDLNFFVLKIIGFYSKIKGKLFNGDTASRNSMAKLFGYLSVHLQEISGPEFKKELLAFFEYNINPDNVPERNVHGTIILVGYYVSFTYRKMNSLDSECVNLIHRLIPHLFSKKQSIPSAVCEAIGYMGLCNVFTAFGSKKDTEGRVDIEKEDKGEEDLPEKKKRKIENLNSIVVTLVLLLKVLMASEKNLKLQEKIIECFGKVCYNSIDESLCQFVLPILYEMKFSKNTEIHFVIGETLSCFCGFSNLYDEDWLISSSSTVDLGKGQDVLRKKWLKNIISFLIHKGTLAPQKLVRQNLSIWLVAVVKYCQKNPYMKSYIYDLQEAFSVLITDHTNRITASCASRGLTYVYQMGDENLKKELVGNLMSAFRGKTYYKGDLLIINQLDYTEKKVEKGDKGKDKSKQKKEKMKDESKMEKKKVPETYKELVRIADEVGDPTLLYKLLNVSNQNQIWNSKRAAAFSSLTILQNSKDLSEFKKIVPKILPKLFIYKYNPNKEIARTMTDMFNQFVEIEKKKTSEVIDIYKKEILAEIRKCIVSKLWRNNQASCSALSALVTSTGRTFEDFEKDLIFLMNSLFRMTDHIKDTVRIGAVKLLHNDMKRFLIKICNPKHKSSKSTKGGLERAVDMVIPYILNVGLKHKQDIVFYLSLSTLMKICEAYKESTNSYHTSIIGKYVTDLLETLLLMMTKVEPQQLNYLASHVERLGVNKEEYNALRVKFSSSITSPISSTISICLRFVNKDNIGAVVMKLVRILEGSIGIVTRVNTVKIISDIAKLNEKDLSQKMSTKLIHTMFNILKESQRENSNPNDISINERKQMAKTVSYLLNSASNKRKREVVKRMSAMFYLIGDHERDRDVEENSILVGLMVEWIYKKSFSTFEQFYENFFPIMFLGKNTAQGLMKNEDSILSKFVNFTYNDYVITNDFTNSISSSISSSSATSSIINTVSVGDSSKASKIFKNMYKEQLITSEFATIEKNMKIIIERCFTFIDHSKYSLRSRGCLGIMEICNVFSKNNKVMDGKIVGEVLNKLMSTLNKTKMLYKNKELLICSLSSLIYVLNETNCSSDNFPFLKNIIAKILNEIRSKKKSNYRFVALKCFQKMLFNRYFFKNIFDMDLYKLASEVFNEIIREEEMNEEKERLELKEKEKKNREKKINRNITNQKTSDYVTIREKIKVKICETFGLIIPTKIFNEECFTKFKTTILPKLLSVTKLTNFERFGLLFSFTEYLKKLEYFYLKDKDKVKAFVDDKSLYYFREIVFFNLNPEKVNISTRNGSIRILEHNFIPFLKSIKRFSFSNLENEVVKASDFEMLEQRELNLQIKESIERLRTQMMIELSYD